MKMKDVKYSPGNMVNGTVIPMCDVRGVVDLVVDTL